MSELKDTVGLQHHITHKVVMVFNLKLDCTPRLAFLYKIDIQDLQYGR